MHDECPSRRRRASRLSGTSSPKASQDPATSGPRDHQTLPQNAFHKLGTQRPMMLSSKVVITNTPSPAHPPSQTGPRPAVAKHPRVQTVAPRPPKTEAAQVFFSWVSVRRRPLLLTKVGTPCTTAGTFGRLLKQLLAPGAITQRRLCTPHLFSLSAALSVGTINYWGWLLLTLCWLLLLGSGCRAGSDACFFVILTSHQITCYRGCWTIGLGGAFLADIASQIIVLCR